MKELDLTQFVKEIGQPDPIAFQRRANTWLAALRPRVGTMSINGAPLDPLDTIRGAVNVEVGRALADLAVCRALAARFGRAAMALPPGDAARGIARMAPFVPGAPQFSRAPAAQRFTEKARVAGWIARRQLQHQVQAWRAPPKPREWGERPALIVTRVADHLPHVLPIAVELRRSHGLRSVVAVGDAATRVRVEDAGFATVDLYACAPPNPLGLAAQSASLLARTARAVRGLRPAGFEPIELAAIVPVTRQVVAQNASDLIRLAHGIDWVIERARPSLVLAANPYTVDGRAAWRLGAARGVPTAAVEHGTVFVNDPIWDECGVDVFCAWGEPSRQSLMACGLKDERIAVVGAAYLDAFVAAFEAGADEKPSILVATSGPGDLVSHEQHAAFIEMLYEASVAVPEVRFVVKLHRKDRPELYAAAAARHPGGQIEIVRHGPLGDIFKFLRGARAMITIASAAALEAMVVRVPVITVQVSTSASTRVEFIERGCTRHVKSAAALAKEIKAAFKGTRDPATEAAAHTYAGEHFANLGHAAAAAASRLAELAARKR